MMKVAKTTLRSVLCAALFTLGTVSTFAWLIGFGSGLAALCAALLYPSLVVDAALPLLGAGAVSFAARGISIFGLRLMTPNDKRQPLRTDLIGWIGFVDDETLRMTLDAGKEVPNGYAKTTN
jgi:hypothetical protein